MTARHEPDPWTILRAARAELDPDIGWLQTRLQAAGAQAWLQQVRQMPESSGTDARTALVADAIRRAERIVGGDPQATIGVDEHFLRVLWNTLAERAPGPVAELAAEACVRMEQLLAAPAPQRPASNRVGSYELQTVLGAGASGTVYRARHCDNGMQAAIKLLRLDANGPEQIERFRQEARIASRLQHPALVRILDSGVHEDGGVAVPYLVSELVEGQPFSTALRSAGLPALLQAFAELCDGIAHAHRCGVLHRDLKPANVLVSAALHPHVLDFGCARSSEGGGTLPGQVLGTPAFMSPEQASGHNLDPRSDQWSLAALLFDALAGEPPHALVGLPTMVALQRVAKEPPRRLRSLRPELPEDLAAVVDKALAADPALRYAGVDELARDVRRLLAGDPVAARPPSALQSLWRLTRRHRVAAGVLAAFVALVTVGGVTATVLWQRAAAAEARLAQGAAEAFEALQTTAKLAAHLAETTTAAQEQLQLLEPVLEVVARLQAISGSMPRRWLQVEAGLREIAGDLANRLKATAPARAHRLRVIAIERELMAAGAGRPPDLARALVKLGDLDWEQDRAAALAGYQAAHAIFVQRAAGGDLDAGDDLCWSFHRLAGLAMADGRRAEAVALAGQHVALAEQLIARSPDAMRHYNLASAINQWHKATAVEVVDDAHLARLRRAVDLAEVAVQREPDRFAYLTEARVACFALGMALARRQDPAAARPLLLRILALLDLQTGKAAATTESHEAREMAVFMLGQAGNELTRQAGTAARALAEELATLATARVQPRDAPGTVGIVAELLQRLGRGDEVQRLPAPRPLGADR